MNLMSETTVSVTYREPEGETNAADADQPAGAA